VRGPFRFGVVLVASVATLSVRAGAQQVRDTLRVIYPDTVVATLVAADSTPKKPLRLCAGGDITLGSNLDSAWAINAEAMLWSRFARRADPDSMLVPVRPLFEQADVVLVNIEGAIGDGPAFKKCGPKSRSCFAFRQPPAAADALRHLGGPTARVVGNLANNHSHDAGPEGLAMTRALLDSAGVQITGADTLATPVVTERGDTIAILGFYTGSDSPDARDFAAVRRYVARAVSEFGVVIVTMHLGAEGAKAQRTKNANELFVGGNRGNPVAFARAALAAGATAVIGHGPHVLRAGEWRDSSLVLYSLGNLVNYGTFGLGEPMNHGAVACMNIDGPRSVSAAHIESTIQIAPGVVLSDWSAGSAALIDSLSRLDFPRTGVAVSADGSIGRRPPPTIPPEPPARRKRKPPR
jgi:hypothetical protein